MDLDDLGPRLGCGLVLSALVIALCLGFTKMQSDAVQNMIEREAEGGMPRPASSAIARLEKSAHSDPVATLAAARALLGGTGSDEEKKEAREMLPRLIAGAFRKHVEAARWDAAQALADEAASRPFDNWTSGLGTQLATARRDAVRRAVQSGDDKTARTHLTALLAGRSKDPPLAASSGKPSRDPTEAARVRSESIELWNEWAVRRFKRAGRTDDAALAPLVEAAGLTVPGGSAEPERTLRELPAARLLEVGRSLADKDPIAASHFFQAAQHAARGAEDERREAGAALARTQLAGARRILAGKSPGFGPEHVTRLLGEARRAEDPVVRAGALQGLLDAELASSREARASNHGRAFGHLETAMWLARELWLAQARAPGADALAMAPAAERETVEDENPGAPRERLIAALEERVQQKRWQPPEVERIARELPGLQAEWGLAELAKDREHALPRLRSVLRGKDDAARAKVSGGMRAAVRDALAKNDFPVLLDLCGFTIAELSIQPGDPFRDELKKGLEAAGEHFRASSPMTRVFVLSLMADVLAPDPAAEQARAEALESGATLIATLPRQDIGVSRLRFPTGMPGTSALRVDNGTEYHLMVFFEGPEKFFVRLNPVRRGTVALKDGTYQTAVIVTKDDVTPYRGTLAFASDVQTARYYIRRGGSDARPQYELPASGPYRLLRAPAGADRKPLERFAGDAPEGDGGEEGLAKLSADLAGKDTGVALQALAKLKAHRTDQQAFEAVRQAARGHPAEFVRMEAVKALAVFRRTFDAAAAVLDVARTDKDRQVARTALEIALLARLPGADTLLEELLASPDAQVRGSLAHELGERAEWLPGDRGHALLLEVVGRDPDVKVKRRAARALAKRKAPQAAALTEAMLKSPDREDRNEALGIIAAYMRGDAHADGLLAGAVAAEADRRLRGEMLRMLSARGTPAYARMLGEVLAGGAPAEKLSMMHYLYTWEGELSLIEPPLTAAAADPDPKVKARAEKELARLRARARE